MTEVTKGDHRQHRPGPPTAGASGSSNGESRSGFPPARRPASAAPWLLLAEGHKYFEISRNRDPRRPLVYAPDRGHRNVRRRTDNWRWPRHTGDWSYLRAYVAPTKFRALREGERALQAEALAAGVGRRPLGERPRLRGRLSQPHPALPDLLRSQGTTDWSMPLSIRLAEEQIAPREITKGNRDLAIKAAARVRGLNNGLTNQKGMLERPG